MDRRNKLTGLIIISNVLLFIGFLALGLFGVGELDWDKAKLKLNKLFF